MTGPSVSIVVVTWQSAADLRRLVRSLNRFLDGSQELIVVDNASDDDPAAVARAWKGTGWFLEMARNYGFGAAANAGVAEAAGETVVVLNPDTELVDEGLPRLAAAAIERSALVGPKVLGPDRRPQASASGPPVGIWPWVRAVLPSGVGPRPVLARTAPWRIPRLTRVAWLTGSCLAGPREILHSLGPFDAAIELYGEDLDLGLRAAGAAVPSLFAPQACTILHYGKGSTSKRFRDLGRGRAAANGRAVLRRAHGARAERSAWWAERTNLRLRVVTKSLLGRDHRWDSLVLAGLREAGSFPGLPDAPDLAAPEPASCSPLNEGT